MSEDRNADARDYANVIAAELEDVERGYVDGDRYPDAYGAVEMWADTCALDVEYTVSTAGGGVSAVEITRTIGGPGCWIACNGDGTVTVRAAWGSGEWRRTVDAPTVDAWAWDYVEMVAAAVRP